MVAPKWVVEQLRAAEEFVAQAAMICQDRERAEAIAASCRSTATARSRVSIHQHLLVDYFEVALCALSLGWEGEEFADAEAFVQAEQTS